jgi:hypothetical protein
MSQEPYPMDLLRLVQEHAWEARMALEQGDWQKVGRHSFQAKGLLEEVNREAVRQLAAEREKKE